MPPWLIAMVKFINDFVLVVVEKLGFPGLATCSAVATVALVCSVLKQRAKKTAALEIAQINGRIVRSTRPWWMSWRPRTVDDAVTLMNAMKDDRNEVPVRDEDTPRKSNQLDDEGDDPPSEEADRG